MRREHTTVHDRYHITDDICGLVETQMTLDHALLRAENHAKRHTEDSLKYVSVYDSMHRRNQPSEWQVAVKRTVTSIAR